MKNKNRYLNESTGNIDRLISEDNEKMRERYILTTQCYNRDNICIELGLKPFKGSIANWLDDKKIFCLLYEEQYYYPTFQFEANVPKPIIQRLLSEIPDSFSSWEIAFWFNAPNSWLDGDLPKNCLEDDEHVFDARTQWTQDIFG